ncbi:MAG TPA: hypothetical protein VMX95_05055 [Thermodesulfobacteriota bacterium]|nr:hypothetical protein [Thermodesulfobacteriota bacterium]
MTDPPKKFTYENGLRFEVTPEGLFYSPENTLQEKKYPCPDCKFCQWCSDTRCTLCLKQSKCCQIADKKS